MSPFDPQQTAMYLKECCGSANLSGHRSSRRHRSGATSMDRDRYLKELVAAYQAEVWGEAIFSTLKDKATNEDEIEIWRTLTLLESTMRQRLIPLLERHGLDTTPDEEQRRLGQERGK